MAAMVVFGAPAAAAARAADAPSVDATSDDASTPELAPAAVGPTVAADAQRLDEVTISGSHNTYEKRGAHEANASSRYQNSRDNVFEYHFDALNDVQMIELDVFPMPDYSRSRTAWYVKHDFPLPGSVNDNNCPEAGRIGNGRDQDLRSCLEGLAGWHQRNPDHPLAVIKIEAKTGFWLGGSPAALDDLIANLSGGEGRTRIARDLIFTPRDLMGCERNQPSVCRYPTPDAAAKAGAWPTMGQLRGRFLFTIVPGEASSKGGPVADALHAAIGIPVTAATLRATDGVRQYASALRRGAAHLLFPTPLLTGATAGRDPRSDVFDTPEDVPYAVSFDMELGYLTGGQIPAAVATWLQANHFLRFTTFAKPAPTCTAGTAGDPCRRLWTARQADPARACRDAATRAVDLEAGSLAVRSVVRAYGTNAVTTDQERQGLSFVGQYGGGSPPTSLGAVVLGGAGAITWAGNRHDVFVRGTDGQLWQNFLDPGACRGWSGWLPLGGATITSDVSVVSWGAQSLHLFARSPARTLLHRWWDANGWSAWEDLGGSVVGSPSAAAWSPGRLDVVARDNQDRLTHRWWDGSRWAPWEVLGPQITTDPTIASMRPGRLDIFSRSTGGRLVQVTFDGTWRAPVDLLGGLASRPAVSVPGAGRMDVFVLGTDGRLWQRRYAEDTSRNDDGWSPWTVLGTATGPDISAAAWGSDRSYVYFRGNDGAVWQMWVPA